MNQNPIKIIGIKDNSRKGACLVYINQADGLKRILNSDFEKWSNFDGWESISVQQWIFPRLWRFVGVGQLILNAIVVNIMILFQLILRTLKKKNALG